MHDKCAQCTHERRHHGGGVCLICPAFTTDNHHAFVPAVGETAGEPECSHDSWEKFSSTAKCADCGHTWTVEPPKAHEHDWTAWGAVYHGGHFQWRDCRICGNTESTPEGHFCPDCAPVCKAPYGCHTPRACGDSDACAFDDQLKGIRVVPRTEPEAPSAAQEAALDELTQLRQEMEAQPPRRPPYAVAYELEDGTAYEVALPGDATVGSVGGALIISHTSSPVKGLTQARPMEGQ